VARASSLLLTVALVGCSIALPTDDPRVTAPRGQAPGHCGEVTEFAYVGVSTLRGLGFDDTFGEFGDDFDRRGRFWVTLEALGREPALGAEEAAAARAVGGRSMRAQAPDRPAQRMLCVTWSDGNPIGMMEMATPDDWSPPSRLTEPTTGKCSQVLSGWQLPAA
jgi:hypothetical protein